MARLLLCDVLRKWCPAGHTTTPLQTGLRLLHRPSPEQNQQAQPGHPSLTPSLQKGQESGQRPAGRARPVWPPTPAREGAATQQPPRTSPFHHQNSMSTKVPSKNECDHSPEGHHWTQGHTGGLSTAWTTVAAERGAGLPVRPLPPAAQPDPGQVPALRGPRPPGLRQGS